MRSLFKASILVPAFLRLALRVAMILFNPFFCIGWLVGRTKEWSTWLLLCVVYVAGAVTFHEFAMIWIRPLWDELMGKPFDEQTAELFLLSDVSSFLIGFGMSKLQGRLPYPLPRRWQIPDALDPKLGGIAVIAAFCVVTSVGSHHDVHEGNVFAAFMDLADRMENASPEEIERINNIMRTQLLR